MAKKLNAKQKREAQAATRKTAVSKITEKLNASPAESAPVKPTEKEKTVTGKKEKSSAKAAGLKSAFILSGNRVLMTSFGRGNKAVIEKYIDGDTVTSLQDPNAFEATPVGQTYVIKGRKEGTADNPVHFNEERAGKRGDKNPNPPGMDMLGLKDVLEKKFFETESGFEDNIHIQLIYNILDIEKLLVSPVTNVAYVVNNLRRSDDNEDMMGYLGLNNSYDVFCHPENSDLEGSNLSNTIKNKKRFDDLMKGSRRAYLGDAIYKGTADSKKKVKETDADYQRYYYSLCLIGAARQMLFHGEGKRQTVIYNLAQRYDAAASEGHPDYIKARKEARETLDSIYKERVEALNKNFLSLAKTNLAVLFKVYGADTREKKENLVQRYYDFVVRKDQKNIGFSLKKLREIILATPEGVGIVESCEHSMRKKFTNTFDFAQSVYYAKKPERVEGMVAALRSARTEEEKTAIYNKEAELLWPEIKNIVVKNILPNMNPDVFKNLKEDPEVDSKMLEGVAIGKEADYFSKFIYLLTKFMDGKEINDLLTQLISKFESIGSFCDVLSARQLPMEFRDEYRMFADSWKIAAELRIINSFARMQEPDSFSKKDMYVEAAQILGFDGTEEELGDYVELFLSKDQEEIQEIKKKFWGVTLPGKGFRNFIANNVIESSRFKYLVRYSNPGKIKKIAQNDQIIKLALSEIPDTQIERYYTSCVDTSFTSPEKMRAALQGIIKNLTFTDFSDVKQDDKKSSAREKEIKQKKQNIIRLYLTVLYLVVKNLVRINSRYTLAFHCFERDYELFTGKRWNRYQSEHYHDLTKKFVDERRLNRHSREYLMTNIANADIDCIREYRNCIDHLNAVGDIDSYIPGLKKTESYFALYHYLVQNYLLTVMEKNPKMMEKTGEATNGYFETVRQYGKYRKDFVKALNTPFGYNLARYKNLSIEGLFDKDRPGKPDDGTTDSE